MKFFISHKFMIFLAEGSGDVKKHPIGRKYHETKISQTRKASNFKNFIKWRFKKLPAGAGAAVVTGAGAAVVTGSGAGVVVTTSGVVVSGAGGASVVVVVGA